MIVVVYVFCFHMALTTKLSRLLGENGRILINEISVNEDTFVLCNIYAPTKNNEADQCRFLDTLTYKLEAFKAENIVVWVILISL